jgi:molecular chaperone GrpE
MPKKKQDPVYVSEEEDTDRATTKLQKAKKKLKQAEHERKEYLDGWQRERADFANYKKDIEKYIEGSRAAIREDVVSQFLPMLDNLELALKHTPKDIAASHYHKGIEHIAVQAKQLLQQFAVVEITVKKGDSFDPTQHEAVEGNGEVVAEVLQKGYSIGDHILRPVKVKVQKK